MLRSRWSSNGGLVNVRTGSGTSCPEASTGISSYFSKLMPVCCLVGSSAMPKSSRSRRGFAGPAMCLPSFHCPSPPPRAMAPEAAGLPYALESKPPEARASCHPPRRGGGPPRGAKVGASAQFPAGRGPSAAKPLVVLNSHVSSVR